MAQSSQSESSCNRFLVELGIIGFCNTIRKFERFFHCEYGSESQIALVAKRSGTTKLIGVIFVRGVKPTHKNLSFFVLPDLALNTICDVAHERGFATGARTYNECRLARYENCPDIPHDKTCRIRQFASLGVVIVRDGRFGSTKTNFVRKPEPKNCCGDRWSSLGSIPPCLLVGIVLIYGEILDGDRKCIIPDFVLRLVHPPAKERLVRLDFGPIITTARSRVLVSKGFFRLGFPIIVFVVPHILVLR
mmetsp:Transcript_4617/g.6319  ORF Transcript_4617/g.6319 Transcript_4617/m.6319 type:complete len:248 (-) Transcript_4617:129-872(-)